MSPRRVEMSGDPGATINEAPRHDPPAPRRASLLLSDGGERGALLYPTGLFKPMSIADVAARDYEADSQRAKSLARDLRECGWTTMAAEFSRLGFVAFLAARAERGS